MGDFERDYAYSSLVKKTNFIAQPATFMGIVRTDGRVATRNYIGILTSVNCSATVAKMIARHFENRLDDFPNVDGVVALTHKTGCGMASEGEDRRLRRTMPATRAPQLLLLPTWGWVRGNQINSCRLSN
jgi:altronate hydrolase